MKISKLAQNSCYSHRPCVVINMAPLFSPMARYDSVSYVRTLQTSRHTRFDFSHGRQECHLNFRGGSEALEGGRLEKHNPRPYSMISANLSKARDMAPLFSPMARYDSMSYARTLQTSRHTRFDFSHGCQECQNQWTLLAIHIFPLL